MMMTPMRSVTLMVMTQKTFDVEYGGQREDDYGKDLKGYDFI